MDTYDVFKKLAMGAKFSGNRSKAPKPPKPPKEEQNNEVMARENPEQMKSEPRGKKRKRTSKSEEQLKILQHKEEVNHYRNINKIGVVGSKVPDPAKSFEDFSIDQDLVENLRKCGYEEPTPVQKQAVPIMLSNRHLLACAPTGSGKTAAFLMPIIQELKVPQRKGFRALVLCPTRELAKQTQRECLKLSQGRNLRVHVISKINKDLSKSPYGPKSAKNFDILIATPNRLCYLLKQEPPALSLANVEWLVVDEADKLFETGQRGFRAQLDRVLGACTKDDKKIAMFSATFMPVVAKWCIHNMKGLIRVTVGQKNAATGQVDQELFYVGEEKGKLIAFRDLVKKGINPPVLVFVQSKDRAQQLFNELIYDGINVDAIHADRTQTQRDITVRNFREGKIWVLICTEVMARGIDFKGVNLVINYDFPQSAISYVHRIGRAGRAGRRGKAVTFFTKDDTVNLRSIAHVIKESALNGAECKVPEYLLTIKKKSKKERKKLLKSPPKRRKISSKPQRLRKIKNKKGVDHQAQDEESD